MEDNLMTTDLEYKYNDSMSIKVEIQAWKAAQNALAIECGASEEVMLSVVRDGVYLEFVDIEGNRHEFKLV